MISKYFYYYYGVKYLREVRARVTHVSMISEHNSNSFWEPVTSYDLRQVNAVPSKPVYTVGSTTSLRFQVISTTCYHEIISLLVKVLFYSQIINAKKNKK